MIYINHNSAIEQLQGLINNSYSKTKNYLPHDFNKQQDYALSLLKKRIFLEEIIEETISFNQKLFFESKNNNLNLVNTPEELLEVFKLRSTVYTDLGYQNEFPDIIEGLNFDNFDKNAAILFYKSNNEISGTTRLIFDSHNKLPTDNKFSLDSTRRQYNSIGELSRLIVNKEKEGLNLEFKYLMQGIHTLFMHNKIDITILAIIEEHYKLYTKFGGSEIIEKDSSYGNMEQMVYILQWDPSQASKFFKKAFLS